MEHHHHSESNLTFDEKMIKLIDHWIKHNNSHVDSYKKWAIEAKENGSDQVVQLLNDVSETTLSINGKFEEVLRVLKQKI